MSVQSFVLIINIRVQEDPVIGRQVTSFDAPTFHSCFLNNKSCASVSKRPVTAIIRELVIEFATPMCPPAEGEDSEESK